MMQTPHIELSIIAIKLQTIFDESLKDGPINKIFTNPSSLVSMDKKINYVQNNIQ